MNKKRNSAETKDEVVSKLDGLLDKVADFNPSLPRSEAEVSDIEKDSEKSEILAKIRELNEMKKEEKKEEKEIVSRKPKFKIKDVPATSPTKKTQFTESQLDALTFSTCQGICLVLKKEDMKAGETQNFSSVLYEIGSNNGWWDKLDFLPYLVLTAATVELGAKIMNKPPKGGRPAGIVKTENIIPDKKELPPTNKELGKVDVVDQDLLVKKLGGGRIFTAESTEVEE